MKAERNGNPGEEEGSNMDKNPETKAASRRDFFKKTGLGVAVAAGAAGAAPGAAKASAPAADAAGYAETAHVKTYYELAK
ncbi:MAG: twin-arginine translocation signal domain-containing protein [Tagaea sp.]